MLKYISEVFSNIHFISILTMCSSVSVVLIKMAIETMECGKTISEVFQEDLVKHMLIALGVSLLIYIFVPSNLYHLVKYSV